VAATKKKKKGAHHGSIPSWALRPTFVPLALLRAIFVAAKKYNVPPDLLAGIWREESGSTYPNPAKNSSGYGGLFGTSDAYGTTQAQANLAASILHNGLVQSKGNVAEALSYYNSGKLSGGYTSVPGQVTTGTIAGYGGKPTKGGKSTLGEIESVGGSVAGVVTNPLGAVGSLLGKGAGAVTGGIASEIDKGVMDIVYAGAILGGGLVFILGFVLIAADIGLSTRAGKIAAAVPAGRFVARAARSKAAGGSTSKAGTGTSKPQSNIPGRKEERAEEMHKAKLSTEKAKATELRTRQKNRRRTRAEQSKAEQSSYYAGARDAASPTMAKIRKGKKSS
jgi:hypothetical protein